VRDPASEGCSVEGCEAVAAERAPGVSFCDRHWDALCDAYARERPSSWAGLAGSSLSTAG